MAFNINKKENFTDWFNRLTPVNFEECTKPNGKIVLDDDGQRAFVPDGLPPKLDYDKEMIWLLAEAGRKVGELRGRSGGLRNPYLPLRSYLKREAVVSSRIEGTMASIEDLNRYEVLGIGKAFAERLRLQEVVNCVKALEWALKEIGERDRGIDLDLIRGAHRILMDGVRGEEQNPGEFRDRQNRIVKAKGHKGSTVYTPPPPKFVPKLLNELEAFCNARNGIPHLIRCAMIHYQFEAVHPFGDGNGRIDRLLVLLVLHKTGLLPEPLLCLSAFFDRYRAEYYGGLLEVSRKGEWNAWTKFFLRAFAVQSAEAIEGIKKLDKLYDEYRRVLRDRNAGRSAVELVECLFENPYVSIPLVQKRLNVSYQAARKTAKALVGAGILVQTDLQHRSMIFAAAGIEASLRME